MAAGRRSGDPTDLLLVDPSQPEEQSGPENILQRDKRMFSSSTASPRLYFET